ncbi:MAG: hypothetical protein OEM52_11775 [bacterium]|nr:hypothetical protein [bacterium]
MKRLPYLAVLLFVIVFGGCGKDESPEDSTPPLKPILYPLLTMETIESDSTCGPFILGQYSRNGFRIAWQNPVENDIASWIVNYRSAYSGNTPSGLFLSASAREYVVRDAAIFPDPITDSVRAFEYWVHAVDAFGNVSVASDTMKFSILREVDGLTATNLDLGVPLFQWNNPYSNPERSPNQYSLKVLTINDELVWRWDRTYDNSHEVVFNDDGSASSAFLDSQNRLLPGEYYVRFEFWQTNTLVHGGSVAIFSFTIQ